MKKTFLILTTSYPKWNETTLVAGQILMIHGKFVHDMARSLVQSGCTVHVLTQHGENTEHYKVVDGVHIHRFHYLPARFETLTKGAGGIPENIKQWKNKLQVPIYFMALIINALLILRKEKVDIINAHWAFPTGFIGNILKFLSKRPLLITAYGAELFTVESGAISYVKPFLKWSLRKADYVAGISQETVNSVQRISGRQNVAMIPDGIDIDYYSPGMKDVSILLKYKQNLTYPTIFFTGRMVERKGHKFLAEAMAHLKKKGIYIQLILGGDGPEREIVEEIIKTHHLEDRIYLPGFLPEEDIVPLLRSCDLYVLPSCIDKNGDTEGSATAAFEAMACETPVLVGYVGGNIGAIKDGMGAYYFQSANALDLSFKIEYFFNTSYKDPKFKKDARQYIESYLSWNSSIKKYFDLIGG